MILKTDFKVQYLILGIAFATLESDADQIKALEFNDKEF